jgi:hypothetical protein
MKGGVEQRLVLLNTSEVTSIEESATDKQIIEAIYGTGLGQVVEGVKQVIGFDNTLVVNETSPDGSIHSIVFTIFHPDKDARTFLAGLVSGNKVYAVLQRKEKTNDSAYLLFGQRYGLKLSDVVDNSKENDGAMIITLSTEADYTEPSFPKVLRIDYDQEPSLAKATDIQTRDAFDYRFDSDLNIWIDFRHNSKVNTGREGGSLTDPEAIMTLLEDGRKNVLQVPIYAGINKPQMNGLASRFNAGDAFSIFIKYKITEGSETSLISGLAYTNAVNSQGFGILLDVENEESIIAWNDGTSTTQTAGQLVKDAWGFLALVNDPSTGLMGVFTSDSGISNIENKSTFDSTMAELGVADSGDYDANNYQVRESSLLGIVGDQGDSVLTLSDLRAYNRALSIDELKQICLGLVNSKYV